MSMGQGDFGLDNLAYSGTKVDDSANFNKKAQAISANTKKLNQHVKEIQRLCGIIGTEMDDSSIREQLQQRQNQARKTSKETEKLLRELKQSAQGAESKKRVALTKVAREFSSSLNDYQRVQRECIDKERSAAQSGTQLGQNSSNGGFDIAGGDQMQAQTTATDLEAIQQRERDMAQMEADIMDVNTIFKDLGEMVQESGAKLDSIEDNVASAVIDVQEGNQHLVKAREYQSKATKKKICMVVTIIVIIIIVSLIIYFSVK